MAETRYTDPDDAEPGTAEAVEQEFEVELAGLNENEIQQVREALTEAEFIDGLDELNIDEQIMNAEAAEDNRQEAELDQRDQAEAADSGDYEGAREAAQGVEENLAEASQQGASLDNAIQENNADVEVLTEAEFQQDTAEYFAEASIDNVDDSDYDADSDSADDYAESAADTADDYADLGDQGGIYSDQSILTDNG